MPEKPDLAALIASRICHDLISPIGAIGNGVELMMMDSSGQSAELTLISESVANANARIRFFRVAFGSAGAEQRISRAEVMSILTDVTRGGRLVYAWNSAADLPRREVRLVFLLLQCLETAMAYGGRVRVDLDMAAGAITAEAPRLKIDPNLWQLLVDPASEGEVSAGQVHFALARDEVERQGRNLVTEIREAAIRLSF